MYQVPTAIPSKMTRSRAAIRSQLRFGVRTSWAGNGSPSQASSGKAVLAVSIRKSFANSGTEDGVAEGAPEGSWVERLGPGDGAVTATAQGMGDGDIGSDGADGAPLLRRTRTVTLAGSRR